MENMVTSDLTRSYKGRKVLITGHTGFKGSWLALWVSLMGGKVYGISLDPDYEPNHWDNLDIDCYEDIRLDINDETKLKDTIQKINPEMIFHLAAQPLVRRSYNNPVETWKTNVMGTLNVMMAARSCPDLESLLVVTTDKCYENKEWEWGYREIDRLGGSDPYSASKAATEILVQSFTKSFLMGSSIQVATGRAGNVIGGGDWSEDRLVPDIVRSITRNETLVIRSPQATRPWQHVLESVSGYLSLAQQLIERNEKASGNWNFGPDYQNNLKVEDLLSGIKAMWPELKWGVSDEIHPAESNFLMLDSSKAQKLLKWEPVLTLQETLQFTVDWYKSFIDANEVISINQLNKYIKLARERGVSWAN